MRGEEDPNYTGNFKKPPKKFPILSLPILLIERTKAIQTVDAAMRFSFTKKRFFLL